MGLRSNAGNDCLRHVYFCRACKIDTDKGILRTNDNKTVWCTQLQSQTASQTRGQARANKNVTKERETTSKGVLVYISCSELDHAWHPDMSTCLIKSRYGSIPGQSCKYSFDPRFIDLHTNMLFSQLICTSESRSEQIFHQKNHKDKDRLCAIFFVCEKSSLLSFIFNTPSFFLTGPISNS